MKRKIVLIRDNSDKKHELSDLSKNPIFREKSSTHLSEIRMLKVYFLCVRNYVRLIFVDNGENCPQKMNRQRRPLRLEFHSVPNLIGSVSQKNHHCNQEYDKLTVHRFLRNNHHKLYPECFI